MHSESTSHDSAKGSSQGQHNRPGGRTEGISGPKFLRVDDVWQDGTPCREKEATDAQLDRCEGIQKPDIPCISYQQKAERNDTPYQVSENK